MSTALKTPENKVKKPEENFFKRLIRQQLFIPIAALILLLLFNLIADPTFFRIALNVNSAGDLVFTGNLISILDNASELVILAIGMTLVIGLWRTGHQRGCYHGHRRQCHAASGLRRSNHV